MNDCTANPRRIVPDELDESTKHRILADECRRALLAVLSQYRGAAETTLGELASDVDRIERSGESPNESPDSTLLIELHHIHLPILEEAQILKYDPDEKRVVLPDPAPGASTATGHAANES